MTLKHLAMIAILGFIPVAAMAQQVAPQQQQMQQQPPDPIAMQLKIEDMQFLLQTREDQVVKLAKQMEANRAYWASYVEGITPSTSSTPSTSHTPTPSIPSGVTKK